MNKKITKKDLIFIIALCLIIGLFLGMAIGINIGAEAGIKSCEKHYKTIAEEQTNIPKLMIIKDGQLIEDNSSE